jgi:ABC-type Na+ efflux pump permease subunit
MKFTGIQSVPTLAAAQSAGRTQFQREDRVTPRRLGWAALYAILLASVGLCVGASRLAAIVGHPALFQYGAAVAILGLLVAWVRSSRAALSPDTPGARVRSGQPFSVLHVAFSRKATGSGQPSATASPDTAKHAAGTPR